MKKIVNVATYRAMKKLLKCYEEKVGLLTCPLCVASEMPWDMVHKCKRCAWNKFEGTDCLPWSTSTFGEWRMVPYCRSMPYHPRYNEVRLKRIEMLKDWMSRSIVIPFWPF